MSDPSSNACHWLPTIHDNGTSKERLVAALCNVSEKLDEVFAALKQTAPNGRDYYPQGPEAMEKARQEHDDRCRRLDAFKKEIDDLTVAIDEL